MTDLEARIARLEAREAIRDLVTDYSMAVDDRDIEAIGAQFCEDGSFSHADGTIVNDGRDAVIAHYDERLGSMGPTYHYPHSHKIVFDDDDHAHGVVLGHSELAMDGRTVQVALRYLDEYRREDGAWKFASRSIQVLYFMPMDELVAGGLAQPLRKMWPGPDAAPTDLPESLATWQAYYEDRGRT